MFLYNKPHEVSGNAHYENYDTGTQMISGLKIPSSPTHLTGTVRFLISKRDKKVIPSKEGRVSVDQITAQFGLDEIKRLENNNIYLEEGKFKLEYGGKYYRLVDKNDFGQPIDNSFIPFGIIEVVFEKQRHDR